MAYKIHVTGFAKNRTVEGVLNAYTVIHPNCSIAEINKAFPASCHSSGKPLLGTVKDFNASAKTKSLSDDYMKININTSNGKTAYLLRMWGDNDMMKVAQCAKKEDIDISDFKDRKYFVPGSYTLEYVNGWKPGAKAPKPMTGGRKAAKGFSWLTLLLILLLGILLFFLYRYLAAEKEQVAEEVEQVETEFNAVKFKMDSYALNDDAKAVLDKLADVMNMHEKYTLRIEGHTSKEGDETHNQKLSENRAKATFDYLMSKGVAEDRLEYEGMGSSHPIDTENLAPNRRTEFILSDGSFTFRGLWEDLIRFLKSF